MRDYRDFKDGEVEELRRKNSVLNSYEHHAAMLGRKHISTIKTSSFVHPPATALKAPAEMQARNDTYPGDATEATPIDLTGDATQPAPNPLLAEADQSAATDRPIDVEERKPNLTLPALAPTSLPDAANKKARVEAATELAYEDLPQEIQKTIDAESKTFLTAASETHAGPSWWPKLQKVRKYATKNGSKSSCLTFIMRGSGAATWTKEEAGEQACLTCTNQQRPCLAFDKERQVITLLPLVEAARSKGAGKSETPPRRLI